MYIYATLEGGIFRFSTISWIEWLKHAKTQGMHGIGHYAKHLGDTEGEMVDWEEGEINYALEKIATRKRKRKSE